MIAGGGGAGLTKEQPENNIVRTAYYALISALSGTQTMALCTYDEAFTIPTEEAAQLALRTMQVMIHEMGIRDTVDPLGGSYYVETLTNEFEQAIRREMKKVDAWGGIVRAVATGRVQEAVSRQAYAREKAVQEGRVMKVGVNCHVSEETPREVAFHPYNAAAAEEQVARLRHTRSQRDPQALRAALDQVRADAHAGRNLMPAAIAAVKVYASVGEITGVLKEVFGEYDEPIFFD